MIYIDYKRGSGSDGKGNELLQPIIRKLGIPCETADLVYADAAFEGKGPNGTVTVGIERKTLNDMLNCIDDARFSDHQRTGMLSMYSKGCAYLCLEGLWGPGNGNGFDGTLMQGYRSGQSWGPLKLAGNRRVLYSKLYRYLMSISISGVIITYSNDLFGSAYNICEMYQYFQKPWHQHTSLLELQKFAIPTLAGKATLVRKWATDLTGIGVVHSQEAERLFKTGFSLANSTEEDWLTLPGIGPATAKKVVREIRGMR